VANAALTLWNASTGEELAQSGRFGQVIAYAFSPDGSFFWYSTNSGIELRKSQTGAKMNRILDHVFGSRTPFSPDGAQLVSAYSGRFLKLWDALTGSELATLNGHKNTITAWAFFPDGFRIASCSADKTVKIWDATSGRELITLAGHSDTVRILSLSADGARLVSAAWKNLHLWDTATGKQLAFLSGHDGMVDACAFSPDGSRIVSSSADVLKVWEVSTGNELVSLEGVSCLEVNHLSVFHGTSFNASFSPDSSRMVAILSGKPRLLELATGREALNLAGSANVYAGFFSPDGLLVAIASRDGRLSFLDGSTGARICGFKLDGIVSGFGWSHDGRLAAGTNLGHVYLLQLKNVKTGPTVATAWCRYSHPRNGQSEPQGDMAVVCPYCLAWSSVREEDLGGIIRCPVCGKPVKLNSFTIDADWRPIAKAWRKSNNENKE
jgi:WD40 repeat protein